MKKKYIVLISIILLIGIVITYLLIDFKQDISFLNDKGMNGENNFNIFFEGYDNYCQLPPKEGENYCNIYYGDEILHPSFGMNINFGDNTSLNYSIVEKGLIKKEYISIIIDTDSNAEGRGEYYCKIDEDFNVIEDSKKEKYSNDAYCGTDDFEEFLDVHSEYLEDALEKYVSYYEGFSMARDFPNLI